MKKIKESIWYKRLKSDSPEFFNKLRKFFLWLAGVAAACFTAYYAIPEEFRSYIPESVMKTATITAFVSSVIGAGISALTTTDTNLSKQ